MFLSKKLADFATKIRQILYPAPQNHYTALFP
jgi:hypothetical protein